jgi:hypothetical protein
MTDIANPTFVAAVVGTRKTRERVASLTAHDRYMAGRRRDAHKRGYHGPLTRAEAAAAFERANRAS